MSRPQPLASTPASGCRRRPRCVTVALTLLLACTALLGTAGCQRTEEAAHHDAGATAPTRASTWICPMHPGYTSDHPGTCPICHMDLVELSLDAHATAASPTSTSTSTSSSSPTATSTSPPHPPAPPHPGGPATPTSTGYATVRLDPAASRLSGVTTAVAVREPLRRILRSPAIVRADEARLHRMQSRVGGWIERLDVNTTGQAVRRGQRALALYSPELLASQQEYLIARQNATRFAGSTLPEVRRGGADLEDAARRRLELLDAPAELFELLDRTGEPQRTVDLTIPRSGFVLEKDVVAGQRIEPGDLLFVIADLATVWVEADIYEQEARLVAVGQRATLRLPNDPTVVLDARVDFLYPTLDVGSRTLRIRMVVPNPERRTPTGAASPGEGAPPTARASGGMVLRPGMFIDAELAIDLGDAVTIPDTAVLATGERTLVFVANTDGSLAPRAVTVGWRGDGKAQILAGIAPGEVVVTAANFLLDAESRLRAAIASRLSAPPAHPANPPGAAAATSPATAPPTPDSPSPGGQTGHSSGSANPPEPRP